MFCSCLSNRVSGWEVCSSFAMFDILKIFVRWVWMFSWRRVLRLRSPLLRMSARSISIGHPRMTFCSLLILLSIGGLVCGTRLSVSILTRKESSSLRKALISWNLKKAPLLSSALLIGRSFVGFHLFPLFHSIVIFHSFPVFSYSSPLQIHSP